MHEEYVFKVGGEELAKVLWYYGLIPSTQSSKYKIVCPFHKDILPSMIVNLDDGSFFCFGCAETGDAFKFVQLMNPENNDLQNCKLYFEILNSDRCQKIDLSGRTKRQKKRSKQLYDESYDYFHGLSKMDWKSEDKDIQEVAQYMRKRGFTRKALERCGAKINYNRAYAIIFPMIDNGKFKGWVCRTTLKTVEKRRKYLYNEGFSRATTLVGEYAEEEVLYIVEGYMDRLRFIQNGKKNVVAILGWKMSHEQIEKIKKSKVKVVVSALDNDECGKKGSDYIKEVFSNAVRFKYKKGIKDPGEMSDEQFLEMYEKTNKLALSKLKSISHIDVNKGY